MGLENFGCVAGDSRILVFKSSRIQRSLVRVRSDPARVRRANTPPHLQAEKSGFQFELAVLVEEGQHLRCQTEQYPAAFAESQCNPLEAHQVVPRDGGGSIQVTQVELDHFGGGTLSGILEFDTHPQVITGLNDRSFQRRSETSNLVQLKPKLKGESGSWVM